VNLSCRKKVLDSGISISVLIEEARQGDDRNDYRLKLSVANKEAFKTNYWLRLRRDSNFMGESFAGSLLADCEGLQKMLIASLKTTSGKS
jgi:four helix bundle protein